MTELDLLINKIPLTQTLKKTKPMMNILDDEKKDFATTRTMI